MWIWLKSRLFPPKGAEQAGMVSSKIWDFKQNGQDFKMKMSTVTKNENLRLIITIPRFKISSKIFLRTIDLEAHTVLTS